jgi:PAS domain S-box-containing protein
LVRTISVLCVDDENSMLELSKLYLERTKEFTVTSASSATDALCLLKSNGIQAIVSDYQMPDMDGIGFLKQVRATDKNTPFIMFTGKGWEAIAIEAFENGADFYLQKGNSGTVASLYADLMHKIRMAVEQRRVEQALVNSELRYRRLFETAQDAILILDGDTGEVIDANRFILDMLGYPLEDFMGKNLWELGFIKDKSMAQKAFTELKTKGYIRYEDIPLETKDGRSMDVEFISNVYPVNRHKIIQCNIRDITVRKQTEAALALIARKLNLLSSITRHDIKNQLLALQGYLDISKGFIHDPTRISEYVTKEEKIANTIAHMISFTKDYEDMGMKAPLWQNIYTVIGKVITYIPMRNIHVNTEDSELEIFADPLLERVFFNLIDNALIHGGEKMTSIQIKTREDNGELIITVDDDGNGIYAEDKKEVFTKGFGKRTGFGLSLSREILSITGITINENGEPGKGARFEMVVPKGRYRLSREAVNGLQSSCAAN